MIQICKYKMNSSNSLSKKRLRRSQSSRVVQFNSFGSTPHQSLRCLPRFTGTKSHTSHEVAEVRSPKLTLFPAYDQLLWPSASLSASFPVWSNQQHGCRQRWGIVSQHGWPSAGRILRLQLIYSSSISTLNKSFYPFR
jgi:hypothetical protein